MKYFEKRYTASARKDVSTFLYDGNPKIRTRSKYFISKVLGRWLMASRHGSAVVVLSLAVILLFGLSSLGSPAYATKAGAGSLYLLPAKFVGANTGNSMTSLNWAGYAVSAASGSVTQVKGSWIQPSVTCPTVGLQAAAFWTGIDGLTSGTVEQTGTLAECDYGVASYYAWYEFYPSASVAISSLIIQPGNVISATVKYSSSTGKFTTTIRDVTTGKSFSKSEAVAGALRSSAEWIVEAPASCDSASCIYPLPNFATASMGKDSTSVSSTDSATISGSSKVISKFGSMVDSLTMASYPNGSTVMAQPSSLSSDGTSFSVTWKNAGP